MKQVFDAQRNLPAASLSMASGSVACCPGAEAVGTEFGTGLFGVVGVMPGLSPEVARQTGGRKGKSFRQGNGHNGAGIGSRIHLKLQGWSGLHLGEKCGELGFRHGFFSYLQTLGRNGSGLLGLSC